MAKHASSIPAKVAMQARHRGFGARMSADWFIAASCVEIFFRATGAEESV
jgi:hypothetical protein